LKGFIILVNLPIHNLHEEFINDLQMASSHLKVICCEFETRWRPKKPRTIRVCGDGENIGSSAVVVKSSKLDGSMS
jgi:hypothetical protein